MTPRSPVRHGRRGFSLLEALMAAVIFLIGFTGLTAMLINASARTGRSTKRALVGRMAYDEFNRFTLPGYDAIPAAGTYNRVGTDPGGRQVTFVTTVEDDCNASAFATTFTAEPLPNPGVQFCCPNARCCRVVRVEARSILNVETGEEVRDEHVGFVTKGCAP